MPGYEPFGTAGTSWTLTRNYFTSASGRAVTQWPTGNLVYRALAKVLGSISETTRRRTSVGTDRMKGSPWTT